MAKELTAADIDAEADAAVEQMEQAGWVAQTEASTQDAATGTVADTDTNKPDEAAPAEPATTQTAPDNTENIDALAEIASNSKPADVLDILNFTAQDETVPNQAINAIREQKAELMTQLMGGEIDAEKYSKEVAVLDDQMLSHQSAMIQAQAVAAVQQQAQNNAQRILIEQIKTNAKAEGIDYDNEEARSRFDFEMSVALAKGEKDYRKVYAAAHENVKRFYGVTGQAQKPARTVPSTPVTLSGLPNAGSSGEKTVNQVLAGLSGPDFDKAFDALPKDQQTKYLKQNA